MGAAVREAVEWAERHPEEVSAIVQRATAFARRFLNRDAIDCYLLQVSTVLQLLPMHLVQRNACNRAGWCRPAAKRWGLHTCTISRRFAHE